MASYLDDFTDEERALIVSIPVRTGFWMSQADDAAGTRDEDKERMALERVLRVIQKKTGDNALTNDVMEFALAGKTDWPAWEKTAATVLADLPRALGLIGGRLPGDALKGFKKAVYHIANVVAQAASEDGGKEASHDGAANKLLHGILDGLSVKTDMSVPENVSEKEKAALQKLLAVLKG